MVVAYNWTSTASTKVFTFTVAINPVTISLNVDVVTATLTAYHLDVTTIYLGIQVSKFELRNPGSDHGCHVLHHYTLFLYPSPC